MIGSRSFEFAHLIFSWLPPKVAVWIQSTGGRCEGVQIHWKLLQCNVMHKDAHSKRSPSLALSKNYFHNISRYQTYKWHKIILFISAQFHLFLFFLVFFIINYFVFGFISNRCPENGRIKQATLSVSESYLKTTTKGNSFGRADQCFHMMEF